MVQGGEENVYRNESVPQARVHRCWCKPCPEPTYAERVRTIQIQGSSDWNVLSAADSRREGFTRLNDHRDHGC
jgi:hypothetical protein